MRLFITEKPSVARDIAQAMGQEVIRKNGYLEVGKGNIITWAIGHLIEQAEPDAYGTEYERWNDPSILPLVPQEWKMQPNPKTIEQLRTIGALLKRVSLVVNCGDAAREGQMIVDELLNYFGYKGPAKRLWLQEMNSRAIQRALQQMKDNESYVNLYLSALARSRADWIIGMNLTRGYTWALREKGSRDTLHLGRVQTPTLAMIVSRDLEIENFQPVEYFQLKANIIHQNGSFEATWVPPEDSDSLNGSGKILDKKVIAEIQRKVSGQEGKISGNETKPKAVPPPLPFSLGDLQKAANKLLGISPMDTLTIAQALYEKHKLTTYPRTDFSHLPENEHGDGPEIIKAVKSNLGSLWDFEGTPDFSIRSRAWDDSKTGDHHGIRPTLVRDYDVSSLTRNELIIYKLIARNFMAQFFPHYRYDSTAVIVECQGEKFETSGTVTTDPGWKVLFQSQAAGSPGKAKKTEAQQLPEMSTGDPCSIKDTDIESLKTSPPPHYDGEKIIDAMERAHLHVTNPKVKATLKERGIGTPATRAGVIENLIARGYVEEVKQGEKTVYIATSKGRLLYKIIPDVLRKPDLTAYVEEMLAKIEQGDMTLENFMDQQSHYINVLINKIKDGSVVENMPSLDEYTPPENKKKKSSGLSKTRPPGRKPASKRTGAGKTHKTCQCGKDMIKRNSAKGEFWGCSGYPECRYTENIKQEN